ncbi:MAG: hypothetical protein ACK5NY_01055 [Burkholderiaceae bacterium]
MKSVFDLQGKNWLIHIVALGILLSGIFDRFSVGNAFYSDPFHHGEFVASLPSVLIRNINFFTIHGAMDWLPAWFSQQIWGPNSYFLPNMLIYTSLDALASLFLYFIITLLTHRENKYRAAILISSAVLTGYVVGSRDVFLILAIFFYFLCETSQSNHARKFIEITLGVSLAVNLLWSFDRGFTGIAGIGLACLIIAISEKRHLLTIVSFAASLLVATWIGAFSLSAFIENFEFLLVTSSQWSFGYSKFKPILFTGLVAIPNGWAIYYLVNNLVRSITNCNTLDRTRFWKETANLGLLIICTILMFKIGVNRADFGHVVMALWMPAIVFLYLNIRLSIFANTTMAVAIVFLALRAHNYWILFGAIMPIIYENNYRGALKKLSYYIVAPKFAVAVLAIPLIFVKVLKIASNYSQNGYLWMSQVSAPPANQSLVDQSMNWVSAEMLRAGSRCVFDLSNNGVINGLTALPACTKYTYPAYATQPYEADMIQELRQRNPPVVVFSSTYWSFSIDGKSMHDRFPELKNYLVDTYPYEKCNFGYCLRYVKQPD